MILHVALAALKFEQPPKFGGLQCYGRGRAPCIVVEKRKVNIIYLLLSA